LAGYWHTVHLCHSSYHTSLTLIHRTVLVNLFSEKVVLRVEEKQKAPHTPDTAASGSGELRPRAGGAVGTGHAIPAAALRTPPAPRTPECGDRGPRSRPGPGGACWLVLVWNVRCA